MGASHIPSQLLHKLWALAAGLKLSIGSSELGASTHQMSHSLLGNIRPEEAPGGKDKN